MLAADGGDAIDGYKGEAEIFRQLQKLQLSPESGRQDSAAVMAHHRFGSLGPPPAARACPQYITGKKKCTAYTVD